MSDLPKKCQDCGNTGHRVVAEARRTYPPGDDKDLRLLAEGAPYRVTYREVECECGAGSRQPM